MKTLFLVVSSTFALGGIAVAEAPPTGPETSVREGLKLIRDNKWDDWMKTYCSTDKLCMNDNSKKSLKTYNLPAIQRRSKNCIKADGSIKVDHIDDNSDTDKKVFVQCEETAMPVPFRMVLENGKWMFAGI